MGRGSSKAGKGGGGGGGNITKPITYSTPSQREQLKMDIENQLFNNYRQYGADGEKANKMIIDEFLKDGTIDKEMADKLRRFDKKAKILEVPASEKQKETTVKAENKSESDASGGLGLNAGYTATTSTYKRYEKRRKRKFDDWWNGNH